MDVLLENLANKQFQRGSMIHLRKMQLFLLVLPLSSFANDVYVGAKTGWVHGYRACESQRLTCDNNAWGGGVFVGYGLNDWLALEAGYNDFGKMKADYPALAHSDMTAPYSGEVQGIELGAKPYWKLNDTTSLFAKIGTLAWRVDVTGDEVGYQYSASDSGWSPMLGAGLETAMTDNLSARLEYQWFHHVGGDSTGGSSLNMLSAGLSYHFGATSPEPISAAPTPQQAIPIESASQQLNETSVSVLYAYDSEILTPAMIEALQPALKRLQAYPQARLTIQAHTDNRGSMAYNQTLSERRAMLVNNYFVGQGIAPSRLTLDAKGETQPIADNSTAEGRELNRRVVLISPPFTAETTTMENYH